MRVRVVEDTADLAVWLRDSLTLFGASTLEVITTTREFERLLSPAPWEDIDVAVLDVMLPGVSGLAIARYLRETHPTVRVVVMTASLPAADEATGVADVVLVKPFATETLIAALGVPE